MNFKLPDSIFYALSLIAAAAFTFSYFRAVNNKSNIQNAKDTIELQNDRIEALSQKSSAQDDAILASEKKIMELETEVKVIKTLPLQQLSTDYHKVSDTLTVIKEHLSTVNKILENQQTMIGYFYEGFQNGSLPVPAGTIQIVQNNPKPEAQK